MTVKSTDRAQIVRFGDKCSSLFDEIEILMVGSLEEASIENAWTEALVPLANFCVDTMRRMNTAMVEATVFIATALGGAPVDLNPPTTTFNTKGNGEARGASVASENAGPKSGFIARLDAIELAFNSILVDLEELGSSGWIGDEYDDLLSNWTILTAHVVEAIENTRSSIN